MPGGDRTGPLGQGPASGRGRGGCAPVGGGRSFFGFGRGLGRGRGRAFWSISKFVDNYEQEKNKGDN